MCTASWWIGPGKVELLFNRDERKDRPRALRPSLEILGETRCILPCDTKSGGTWLLCNEHGLCVYILNHYAAAASRPSPVSPRSRGELPIQLSSQPSVEAAAAWLMQIDLSPYPPCLIGLLDPNSSRALSWDGEQLGDHPTPNGFVTTSSFCTSEVEAYRERRYHAVLNGQFDDSESRRAFHFDLAHADPAYNPLMQRDESETHSVSQVTIERGTLKFRYWEREPNRLIWGGPFELALPLISGHCA